MMNSSFYKKFFFINFALSGIFLIDRISKWLVVNKFSSQEVSIIREFLKVKFHKNFNIAFGLEINKFLLYILIVLILFVLFFFLVKSYRRKDIFLIFTLSLIIIGAMSNVIDRFRWGYVVDFIDIPLFSVFNLADCLVVGGVGMLIVKNLKSKIKS